MNKIITFEITNSQGLDFRIESSDDGLHPYSDLEIEYYEGSKRFLLYNDFLLEGVVTFKNILSKALDGELQLHHLLINKSVGFAWNEWLHNLEEIYPKNTEDIVEKYWLWSTSSLIGNQTWMYNFSNKIVMEISRSYSGHFGEPNDDEISFEDFIKSYKPIVVIDLDRTVLEDWLTKCIDIINNIYES